VGDLSRGRRKLGEWFMFRGEAAEGRACDRDGHATGGEAGCGGAGVRGRERGGTADASQRRRYGEGGGAGDRDGHATGKGRRA